MDIETQAQARQRFKRDIAKLASCKRTELLPTINHVVDQWHIERVEYHHEKKFNCTVLYEGEQITLSARIEGTECAAIAALIYHTLQERGVATPGGVHISSSISTKHHRAGYDTMIAKYY